MYLDLYGKVIMFAIEGVVHESIPDSASGIVPDSVYFEYKPQRYGQEKSKARCARDYALLKKSLRR